MPFYIDIFHEVYIIDIYILFSNIKMYKKVKEKIESLLN